MTSAHVLIVEDDPLCAVVAREILLVDGYAVEVVTNGEAAVAAAERCPPDAVLMDVSLPGRLDGIETARRLIASHEIPIVFVTALDEDTFRRHIHGTEFVSLLRKPFGMAELLGAVRRATGRQHA